MFGAKNMRELQKACSEQSQPHPQISRSHRRRLTNDIAAM